MSTMSIIENEPVVVFTLVHYPRWASLNGMAHLALDRWWLQRVPGLRFWRLFGVGQGNVFSPRADIQRYAMLTVWESGTAFKAFEQQSPVMKRIARRSDEVWNVVMHPVSWHGKWGGRDPFADIAPAEALDPSPWIILTRATIRPTHLSSFLKAVPAVAQNLLHQPEYLFSVGVGEAPLLYQATFSVWRSLPSVKAFAYGPAPHAEVVRRTRREGWYSEDFFARLRPIASTGTCNGVDPLQGEV